MLSTTSGEPCHSPHTEDTTFPMLFGKNLRHTYLAVKGSGAEGLMTTGALSGGVIMACGNDYLRF